MNVSETKAFRADLHTHTEYSIDSLSRVADVVEAAAKKGLSAIAVTDHNEVAGAFEAEKIAKEKGLSLQVIIGEEVRTGAGDLLAYFVKEKILPGPLDDVLFEVQRQGAVCSAAHPFDVTRHGIDLGKVAPELLAKIDAVEAFNARVTLPQQNEHAVAFAKAAGKPTLAGSDAHHPSEVGKAYVEFEGLSALDKSSILSAPRKICGGLSSPFVHAYSRYAAFTRKIGFAKRRGH